MRTLSAVLTVVFLSAFAMAQTVPQGPSPLVIGVYDPVTNAEPKTVTPEAKSTVPQGPSPLVIVSDRSETNTAGQTGIAAPGLPQDSIPMITGGYQAPAQQAVQPASSEQTLDEKLKAARVSFLMDTGVQYASEGEFKEAEQAYLRALQTDPGNADLFFRLSTLYIQMERYEDAAMLLKKLVDAFPDNAMLHNNLSWVYATGGKMKSGPLALRHAREALLIAPYSPSLWNTLAEAYYVFGQYDKALRSSEFAIELLKSQQNPSKDDLNSFAAQHDKIQRAAESSKQMLGLDEEKK